MVLQDIAMLTSFIGWDLKAELPSLGKYSDVYIKKMSMFSERLFTNVPTFLNENKCSTLSI